MTPEQLTHLDAAVESLEADRGVKVCQQPTLHCTLRVAVCHVKADAP